MRVTLTDNRSFNIYKLTFARSFLHGINCNGNSMWNFRIKCVKRFFTDDLCGNLSLWLICHSVFIIKHRTIWQIFQNTRNNIFCILVTKRRTWNDLIKLIQFSISIDCLQYFIFINRIDFIDHKNDRQMQALQLFCDMAFACTNEGCWFHKPQNHINILQCTFCYLYHIFAKFILGFMDARCIQKNDLTIFTCIDRLDTVTGRLRFF